MALCQKRELDIARILFAEAESNMKSFPKDEKNPLANGATVDDLITWLAYQEAKALLAKVKAGQ